MLERFSTHLISFWERSFQMQISHLVKKGFNCTIIKSAMSDREEYGSGATSSGTRGDSFDDSSLSDDTGSSDFDVSEDLAKHSRGDKQSNRVVHKLPPHKKLDRIMNINICSSIVTSANLAELRRKANIPVEFRLRAPQEHDHILTPPSGYVTVYDAYFEAGFTLPPPPLLIEVINSFGLCLSQLTPNCFLYYWGFIKRCEELNLPKTLEYFQALFFAKLASEGGYFHFCPRPGLRFLSGGTSSWGTWKERFFYIRNDGWDFSSEWASGASRVKFPKALREQIVASGILNQTFNLDHLLSDGKMFNLDLLLSRRAKSSGNRGISSTSRQPPQLIRKYSHPPACSKGKPSSGAMVEETSRAKGKEPITSTKRPNPIIPEILHGKGKSGKEPTPSAKRPHLDIPKIRHGKGKSVCPHLPDTDPSQDLWHYPEMGVKILRHSIRDADLAYASPQSSRELGNSAYCDLARMPAVIETLIVRAEAFEEMRSKAEDLENKCCGLTRELSQLQSNRDSTRKQLEEELSDVKKKLKFEMSNGRGYLDTLGGQRYIKSVEDEAVLKYKKSDDFATYLADSSIPVFDECLSYCRQRLVASGRFPGEKFEFLDPDWVELIDIPSSGALTTARSSQRTSLLYAAEDDEDENVDIEGDDS